MTWSVYIIENGGGRVHYSIEQSYADAINCAAWLRKYEGVEAIVIENL